jgi:hypothetical protein
MRHLGKGRLEWPSLLLEGAITTQNKKSDERKREERDNAEANLNDQEPGERQKENQNKQEDDPLAA